MNKSVLTMVILLTSSLLVAQSNDRQAFLEASSRFSRGDYVYAQDLLETMIREYPLSSWRSEAEFFLALTYYQLEEKTRALEVLTSLSTDGLTAERQRQVAFWQGRLFLESQEYTLALESLERVDPGWENASGELSYLLAIGRAYLEVENWDQASKKLELWYNQSSPGDPDRLHGQTLLAFVYFKQALFQNILDLIPEEAPDELLLYRGEALWEMGSNDQAVEVFRRLTDAALEIAVVAYQRLFGHALEEDDLESAQQIVSQAEISLQARPQVLLDFWRRVGVRGYREGDLATASSYLKKVWFQRETYDPEPLTVYYLALTYHDQEDLAGALDVMSEYIELDGSLSKESRELRGRIYLRQEEYLDAAREFRSLQLDYPDNENQDQWTYLRAWSLSRSGRTEEAFSQIASVTAPSAGDSLYPVTLKLRAQLLRKLEQYQRAIETYQLYLSRFSPDPPAQTELLTVLFQAGDFQNLVDTALGWDSQAQRWRSSHPYHFFLHQYHLGLALINLGQFREGFEVLDPLRSFSGGSSDGLVPYAQFYSGWALFKDDPSSWGQSVERFESLLENYPGHSLETQGLYWAGWSSLYGGDFETAESYFRKLSLHPQVEDREGSRYFLARSLLGKGDASQSQSVLEEIYRRSPSSPLAPQALFDHGKIWEDLEEWDLAAEDYLLLAQTYPQNSLAPLALLQRAEMYLTRGFPDSAKEAFRLYRETFPRGEDLDLAFFQGGMAAKEAGQPYEAILVWRELLRLFPSSSYSGTAYWEIARLYEIEGNLPEAKTYYQDLLEVYPELSLTLGVEQRIRRIDLQLDGFSQDEAELQVTIASAGRATSPEGGSAMVELARLYLFREGRKLDVAQTLLSEVLEAEGQEAEVKAQAQYLLGEYHYRQGNLVLAGETFFQVVQMQPTDRDLMAQSLFRAAEMIFLAGNTSQARSLVAALEQNFPGSEWARQGQALLEENR